MITTLTYNLKPETFNLTPESEILYFLSDYPDNVYSNAVKLRDMMLKIFPDIQETLDKPARIIGYGYGPKYAEMICSIIPSQKGLKLGFYKGTELPDPSKLLSGSGKVHRYVEIKSEKDINSSLLKKLLTAAYKAYLRRKS